MNQEEKFWAEIQSCLTNTLNEQEKEKILDFTSSYRESRECVDKTTPAAIYKSLIKLEQDVRDMVGAIEEYHNLSIEERPLQLNANSIALDKLLDALLPKTQALLNRASNRMYGSSAPKLGRLHPKQFWCVIIVARQMLLDDNDKEHISRRSPFTGSPKDQTMWIRDHIAHEIIQLWQELGETDFAMYASDSGASRFAKFAHLILSATGDGLDEKSMWRVLAAELRVIRRKQNK